MKQINEKRLAVITSVVLVLCFAGAAVMGLITYKGMLATDPEQEYTEQEDNIIEEEAEKDPVTEPAVIVEYEEEEIVPGIKDFLMAALEPVGKCLYVYGGGWNEEDTGAGVETMSYGVSPRWVEFFDEQDNTYNYEEHKYEIHNGLDCTGYLGYSAYQVFGDKYADDGYVFSSGSVGDNFLRLFGGTLVPNTKVIERKAGDVMVTKGHVWIVVGECDDGSVLFLQSCPPSVTFSGTPAADGEGNSEAVALAKKTMKSIAPEAFGRYSKTCKCGMAYVTDYDCYSFPEEVLPDPDGLREMSAEEVLEELLG